MWAVRLGLHHPMVRPYRRRTVYRYLWKSISQLRSVTCRMGSHSVTCHPTQANTPRLYPSQTGWYSIYRPFKGGGLSKPRPRHHVPDGDEWWWWWRNWLLCWCISYSWKIDSVASRAGAPSSLWRVHQSAMIPPTQVNTNVSSLGSFRSQTSFREGMTVPLTGPHRTPYEL